jgi:hypothetical protein
VKKATNQKTEEKTACDTFVPQAFKKTFCATCFCSKDDHGKKEEIKKEEVKKEEKVDKVACDTFVPQAFKKTFCATCFCSKDDHGKKEEEKKEEEKKEIKIEEPKEEPKREETKTTPNDSLGGVKSESELKQRMLAMKKQGMTVAQIKEVLQAEKLARGIISFHINFISL